MISLIEQKHFFPFKDNCSFVKRFVMFYGNRNCTLKAELCFENEKEWEFTELELVEDDLLGQVFAQQLNLHRVLVADPKIADFTAAFEDVESLSDLLRFDQGIRPV